MAKRNAKKQATREDIEASDVVCHRLSLMQDDADVLALTMGADYAPSDDPKSTAFAYEERIGYLSVLLGELIDLRVALVISESVNMNTNLASDEAPPAQEGTHAADPEPENE